MQYMRFIALSVALCGSSARAQRVPARELLEFPIGTLGAPGVLARQAAHGVWNPANIAQLRSTRVQVSAATLNAPADQGVSAQLLSVALPIASRTTVGATVLRAAVSDILHTDTDPQSLGSEIPYNTTVLSATVARRTGHLTAGLATRFRTGKLDGTSAHALGVDGGLVVSDLGARRGRVGASTFLWGPGSEQKQARYSAGADLDIWARDTLHAARGGYAFSATQGRTQEHYFFASSRLRVVELFGGIAREVAFNHSNAHVRLGIGLHYARYTVGVGREDSGAGLGSTYQFMLTSVFQ